MSEVERIECYRRMWVLVFFDLPTATKKERKAYASFRKNLEKDGFSMMQYSVYIRFCPSVENRNVHVTRVRSFLPDAGKVSILTITDLQYSRIINIWGRKTVPVASSPIQLELF